MRVHKIMHTSERRVQQDEDPSQRMMRDRCLRGLLTCQSQSSPGPGAQENVSSQTHSHLATTGQDHMPGHQKRATRHVLKILLVLSNPAPPRDAERGRAVSAVVCRG